MRCLGRDSVTKVNLPAGEEQKRSAAGNPAASRRSWLVLWADCVVAGRDGGRAGADHSVSIGTEIADTGVIPQNRIRNEIVGGAGRAADVAKCEDVPALGALS